MVEFSLCFPFLSAEGWIPDNLMPMRGENMSEHSCDQNGGTGCGWTMRCTTAKRLCSPFLVNPTHSQGGIFSVHLTLLFLILWGRMWPGNLWCTPCVKGCAPGPLCESQDKMLSAAGHNRCCTVQLWSMERWKVEKYHKPSCVLTPLKLVCICLPVGCHSLADNHTLNLFITHYQDPGSPPQPLAASSENFWGF